MSELNDLDFSSLLNDDMELTDDMDIQGSSPQPDIFKRNKEYDAKAEQELLCKYHEMKWEHDKLLFLFDSNLDYLSMHVNTYNISMSNLESIVLDFKDEATFTIDDNLPKNGQFNPNLNVDKVNTILNEFRNAFDKVKGLADDESFVFKNSFIDALKPVSFSNEIKSYLASNHADIIYDVSFMERELKNYFTDKGVLAKDFLKAFNSFKYGEISIDSFASSMAINDDENLLEQNKKAIDYFVRTMSKRLIKNEGLSIKNFYHIKEHRNHLDHDLKLITNELIAMHKGLVVNIANSYNSMNCTKEEVILAGTAGLIKSIDLYDARLRNENNEPLKLSTFATWNIRGSINSLFQDKGISLVSMDSTVNNKDDDSLSLHGVIADENADNYDKDIEAKSLSNFLALRKGLLTQIEVNAIKYCFPDDVNKDFNNASLLAITGLTKSEMHETSQTALRRLKTLSVMPDEVIEDMLVLKQAIDSFNDGSLTKLTSHEVLPSSSDIAEYLNVTDDSVKQLVGLCDSIGLNISLLNQQDCIDDFNALHDIFNNELSSENISRIGLSSENYSSLELGSELIHEFCLKVDNELAHNFENDYKALNKIYFELKNNIPSFLNDLNIDNELTIN